MERALTRNQWLSSARVKAAEDAGRPSHQWEDWDLHPGRAGWEQDTHL